jgi:hypothetical protein
MSSFTKEYLTPSATTDNPHSSIPELRGVPFMTHTAALWILRSNLEQSVSPSVRRSRKFVKSLQLMWDSLEPVMRKIDDQNEKVRLAHNARIRARQDRSLVLMVEGAPIKLGAETPAGA